jgi:serine/threonine-protein kinase
MTRWSIRILLGALVALAFSASPSDARANDPATATLLFNEAKTLMGSGKYADACPKLEESQRLDPGIGTQFNLADCYEKISRTASAWALFLDVASQAAAAGQGAREAVARGRATALEPKLSRLTIVAPKDVTGLEVRRNGEIVNGVLWGNAVPVDPGSYTIEASAPGKRKWSTVTTVGPNGAAVSVTVPPLDGQEAPAPMARSERGPEASSTIAGPGSEEPAPDTSRRTVALVVAGAGVVGIGVGTIFGLMSISKHENYLGHCDGSVCDAEGVSLHDDAVRAGTISTVAFGVGLAGVAASVILWLTAPKSSRAPSASPTAPHLHATPMVSGRAGGVMFLGGW